MLTQVNTSTERVLSLQEGADDYVDKPFDPFELIARIQAVLRRTQRAAADLSAHQILRCDEIELNRQKRQINVAGNPITLTTRAFSALEYFMLNPMVIITREQLLNEVWGWHTPIESRAVDIRISELRKALKDHANQPRYIETIVGEGYRFLGQVSGHT